MTSAAIDAHGPKRQPGWELMTLHVWWLCMLLVTSGTTHSN